jgi:hypothetical protein
MRGLTSKILSKSIILQTILEVGWGKLSYLQVGIIKAIEIMHLQWALNT